jgi:DNA-directed RNA polymerase subunit alpha
MTVNIKNWQELKKPNSLEVKSGAMASACDLRRRTAGARLRPDAGQRAAPRAAVVAAGRRVTSIKIENVLHEFSSLAGVREDVTDIVLNVKQIALKMEGEGPKRLSAVGHRPGREVTAGDIAVSATSR